MRRCLINTCLALILIFLAVVSGLALKEYLTARADAFLRAEAAKVADLARITWNRLDIRLRQPGLVLHQARITTPRGHEVAMDRVRISAPLKLRLKPWEFTLGMTGIYMIKFPGLAWDQPATPGTATAAMNADLVFDPDRHQLAVSRLKLAAPPLGDLVLALVLDHFYPGRIRHLDVTGLGIQALDLTYQDQGLAARLMTHDLARFLKEMMDLDLSPDAGSPDRAQAPQGQQPLKGLQDYLTTPGRLGLELRLKQPVKLSQIIYARRVSDLLNMIVYRFTNG